MEKRINIAELLKDCPKGMELDFVLFEDPVIYEGIEEDVYPIHIYTKDGHLFEFTEEGFLYDWKNAKCAIFPKGQTTWEGFIPPCKFKDGDIVYIKLKCRDELIIIFKEIRFDHIRRYVCFAYQRLYVETDAVCCTIDVETMRLATEEERQKLFDAIKEHGYRWNPEKKMLEKLIEPKFKVGDKIQHKNGYSLDVSILKINADCYTVKDFMGDQITIDFTHQDNYELVPDKFDLNTLKPFESSVLVRNSKDQYWIPAFWGYRAKDGYVTTFGHCIYCIPFEGNEHLLKTKNDCNEYFKTWE